MRIPSIPTWFDTMGQQKIVGPLPVALLIFAVGLVIAWIMLERNAVGRKVYVIGNNAEVARYSGVDVDGLKLRLFITSGIVAGLAGVLFAARLGSVRGSLAEFFELDIITMVLLGGVSIFGGVGSMLGVALAIFAVLNIRNGLARCWYRTWSKHSDLDGVGPSGRGRRDRRGGDRDGSANGRNRRRRRHERDEATHTLDGVVPGAGHGPGGMWR